jgi:hypothetical protein
MIWTRATLGGILINDISVSVDGVLIMLFAAIALRYAMARDFDAHPRWALRTFIVVSGVWFTRVMYAFLSIVTQGHTPGVTDNMTGPVNIAIGFASYLLPLAWSHRVMRLAECSHVSSGEPLDGKIVCS